MSLLSAEQIESQIQKLPVEWAIVGGTQLEISREFPDFVQALTYVNTVAKLAEEMNHHPDIQLSYGKVSLIITTHSDGGLTKKDFDLAKAVEEIS